MPTDGNNEVLSKTAAAGWLADIPVRFGVSASGLTELRERTRMSALQLPGVVVLEESEMRPKQEPDL